MNRAIYPKVTVIMQESIKEAKSFNDTKVRPEHIVLSMLMDDNNECVRVLKNLNVNTSELYDRISDHIKRNDFSPRVANYNKKTIPFSTETKDVMKSLDSECDKLNDDMIDTIHIMLVILYKKNAITDMLNEIYGVTYDNFKNMIKKMRREQNSAFENEEANENSEPIKKKPRQNEGKSKTPVLDNFCRDVSKAVERGEIDPVIGRSTEIKRVSQILSRRKKNNPVLIGEPGVGKCICADTEVVMKNNITGEIFKTTISKFIKTINK
jgi:ATP-dependent Clp protease ATP-binding subunit ClpC